MNPANSACPGCAVILPCIDRHVDKRYHASPACFALFCELSGYTLMRSRQTFVHQLAIDAYAAQHVAARSPGIGPAFALITLCLVADHDCTGRQAQDAHLLLARKKRDWPRFVPPDRVGLMTVRNIMRAPAGDERDRLIGKWVDDVWQAWSHEHARVKELVVPLLQGG